MFAGHAIFFRRCKNIKTTSYQKIIKIVSAVFEIIAKNVEKWPFSTFFGLLSDFLSIPDAITPEPDFSRTYNFFQKMNNIKGYNISKN